MWQTSRFTDTAEWLCTKCGATNRRLVLRGKTEADDRCVTCHTRHTIRRGTTPVRWDSAAA